MEIHLASSSKKPRMDQETKEINTKLTDFKKIAMKFPNMLVDKTELIYIFCTSEESHEFITAPPRFGKSVNLTMFRCFFKIEVDPDTGKNKTQFDLKTQAVTDTENYRLFADLKLDIMKHPELVKEHLGRHPVLYVNFKCENPIKTVDDAFEFCRIVVQTSFRQHKYLCDSVKLTDREKKFCENWCSDDTYSKMNPNYALKRLAEFLYQHFERDIVLLVDEYDSLVARAIVEVGENSVGDICELNGVDPRVANLMLGRYDNWIKEINQKHNITPVLVRELINASQEAREEICRLKGVDVDVAQQLFEEYKQQMSESWSVPNLPFVCARELVTAHKNDNNILEICKKPVEMIAPLLKTDDENIHLLASLVTGVSYIAGIGWSGIINNLIPYRFTKHHKFNQFYGFKLQEINVLIEKLEKLSVLKEEKNKTLAIINAQYNGYEYPGLKGKQGEKIYCPWSVMNYLKFDSPESFWTGSAYTEPIKNMFHNSDVKKFLLELLKENGTQPLPTVDKLAADDLIKLKRHVKGILTEGTHHLFLNFIFEIGYLTVESTVTQSKKSCVVKLPNLEIKVMILEKLKEHYNAICSKDFKINADMKSKKILERIDSAAKPDVSDEEFETALREFRQELQTLFQQYSGCLPYVNEPGLHCFMAEIITTGNFQYFTEHYVLDSNLNKNRLDVLGFKGEFAFLVELSNFPTSKKSADDDLNQILNKEYFNAFENESFVNIKRHILMGISVAEDMKFAISAIRNYKKGTNSHQITIPFDE